MWFRDGSGGVAFSLLSLGVRLRCWLLRLLFCLGCSLSVLGLVLLSGWGRWLVLSRRLCWLFGLGVLGGFGGVGAPGLASRWMCQSHSGLLSAMCNQLLSLPSGLHLVTVVESPVFLHLILTFSAVSSGRSMLIPLTNAFLLVYRTPDLGRGFRTHAVIRSFGGWRSGALAILPR